MKALVPVLAASLAASGASAQSLPIPAQGGGSSYSDPAGGSIEAGRAEIRRFKEKHASGDLAGAEALLVGDPTFRIERETFTLPKREFLSWTLQCKVFIDDELPPPPSVENVNQVVDIVWFECPAHEGVTRTGLETKGKPGRYMIRTSFISGGRGIAMK